MRVVVVAHRTSDRLVEHGVRWPRVVSVLTTQVGGVACTTHARARTGLLTSEPIGLSVEPSIHDDEHWSITLDALLIANSDRTS